MHTYAKEYSKMSTAVPATFPVQNVKSSRRSQIVACTVTSLFVLGNFIPWVGAWTGPILPTWFVGTQKPRRGFLWMIVIPFVPGLIFGWRKIPLTGEVQALEYLGWALVAAVLGILPFTFHRLVSPRLCAHWLNGLHPRLSIRLDGLHRLIQTVEGSWTLVAGPRHVDLGVR